jgi:hypothetical protein
MSPRSPLLALLLAGCAAAVSACGAIIDRPTDKDLNSARTVRGWQVYWLGQTFAGLPLASVYHDPSGSYQVQYGNCSAPGGSCPAPLTVVSTPDPTFVPGAPYGRRTQLVRGVPVFSSQGGRTLHIATGAETVTVFALSARRALSAARSLYSLNNGASQPFQPLPAPQPNINPLAEDVVSGS